MKGKCQKVLILCTGNSCRSQMAEGFLRHFGSDKFEVFSAGSKPSKVNPVAIEVMQEEGVDISGHSSKHVEVFRDVPIDIVITVCDNAKESCPVFWGQAARYHWSFPDPPHDQAITEEVKNEFRRVRDMIKERFKRLAECGDPLAI